MWPNINSSAWQRWHPDDLLLCPTSSQCVLFYEILMIFYIPMFTPNNRSNLKLDLDQTSGGVLYSYILWRMPQEGTCVDLGNQVSPECTTQQPTQDLWCRQMWTSNMVVVSVWRETFRHFPSMCGGCASVADQTKSSQFSVFFCGCLIGCPNSVRGKMLKRL